MCQAPACYPCAQEPTTPPNSPCIISPDGSETSFKVTSEEQEMVNEMIDNDDNDADLSNSCLGSGEEDDLGHKTLQFPADCDQEFFIQINADGEECSVLMVRASQASNKEWCLSPEDPMLWDKAVSPTEILHCLTDLLSSPINTSML